MLFENYGEDWKAASCVVALKCTLVIILKANKQTNNKTKQKNTEEEERKQLLNAILQA